MAQSTLAVLEFLKSSEFPQVFPGFIDRYIQQVDQALALSLLTCCEFTFPEDCGPAFGIRCSATATVLNLEDEREYCGKHFQEVL